VQTWNSRDANTCALVYDAAAGPELTLTELEIPGSTLVSIFTESGSFDTGFTEVGVIDLSTRTITLPASPGVTIVYFKNLYEDNEGCSLTPGYWQSTRPSIRLRGATPITSSRSTTWPRF
jgi:hypothetical protein